MCMQNTEETIAKYTVHANMFRLGSTNPKNISRPWMLEKIDFFLYNILIFVNEIFFSSIFFSKVFKFTGKMQNVLNRKKNKI